MEQCKFLFIDRDGTLLTEPADEQIDHIDKFALEPHMIPALLRLKQTGYRFVMISNQDGLGTASFPTEDFALPQRLLIDILASQGIVFDDILICPHHATDHCDCRKPNVGLVLPYLQRMDWNRAHSYVIGDRQSDIDLAQKMGIPSLVYGRNNEPSPYLSSTVTRLDWPTIAQHLTSTPRQARIERKTAETKINVFIDLDRTDSANRIHTGIGFYDHMLAQLAKHGGFHLDVSVTGDLHVDEHHTVEDTAITIGTAIREALGNKLGIARYGFVLPMDEALCQVSLDLSGRAFVVFEGVFPREQVGEFPTELVAHFFRSLCEALGANCHITVTGDNTHHMIESCFKGVGRSLRQAIQKIADDLPSTKGVL